MLATASAPDVDGWAVVVLPLAQEFGKPLAITARRRARLWLIAEGVTWARRAASRTERVSSGFYTSQAQELLRR